MTSILIYLPGCMKSRNRLRANCQCRLVFVISFLKRVLRSRVHSTALAGGKNDVFLVDFHVFMIPDRSSLCVSDYQVAVKLFP